jgi:hypothetical protein
MRRPLTGAIVKLRRQDHISRRILLLQAADCRNRNDPANIQRAERVKVCAVIYFVRQNPVAAAMSGQKVNLPPAQFSTDENVRWGSKRRVDCVFGRVTQLLHLVETAATDDPDRRNVFIHARRDLRQK